jgi:hypothetical protein
MLTRCIWRLLWDKERHWHLPTNKEHLIGWFTIRLQERSKSSHFQVTHMGFSPPVLKKSLSRDA